MASGVQMDSLSGRSEVGSMVLDLASLLTRLENRTVRWWDSKQTNESVNLQRLRGDSDVING